MDVIYDDNGKAYLPASDFYKEFIYEQLEHVAVIGDRLLYDELRFSLHNTLIKSHIMKHIETPFFKEALISTTISFDKMQEISSENIRNRHDKKMKELEENPPKLKLVK